MPDQAVQQAMDLIALLGRGAVEGLGESAAHGILDAVLSWSRRNGDKTVAEAVVSARAGHGDEAVNGILAAALERYAADGDFLRTLVEQLASVERIEKPSGNIVAMSSSPTGAVASHGSANANVIASQVTETPRRRWPFRRRGA